MSIFHLLIDLLIYMCLRDSQSMLWPWYLYKLHHLHRLRVIKYAVDLQSTLILIVHAPSLNIQSLLPLRILGNSRPYIYFEIFI